MSINKLPIEILEKIIIEAEETGGYKYNCLGELIKSKVHLPKYALVCRKWTLIANPLIWKEKTIYGHFNYNKGNEFNFYRHITKSGYVCGKYIKKLTLLNSKLWPVCIVKILQACPNIDHLSLRCYKYKDNRGKVNNFLEKIQTLLPKLRKLDITACHEQIINNEVEKLIKDRKDLQIFASRYCKKHPYHSEYYNGKEWEECGGCVIEKRD